MNLSEDQYLALAEYFSDVANRLEEPACTAHRQRAQTFRGLAEVARAKGHPSSCTAPFQVLSDEESKAVWTASPSIRQRVFAPFLTPAELEALRHAAQSTLEVVCRALSARKDPSNDDAG